MKKGLLVVAIIASFVLSFALVSSASEQANSGKVAPIGGVQKAAKPNKSAVSKSEGAAEEPILWQDTFEGEQPHWIPDATWNHVEGTAGGRAYQPKTSWKLVDTNSSSATHSWNATENLDQELDFLVSPVITLPTEVTTGEKTSPLKGLKIGHMIDVDTPDGGTDATNENWRYFIGPAESWWTLSGAMVGAGASAHYLDPTHGSTDLHWRQWLVSPEIDLSGVAAPIALTFTHNYKNEKEFDYYAVDVSTDDFVTYTSLAHWGELGASGAFVNENLDLSGFAGQKIKIRFASKGDYGTAEGFWAVDEIKVTGPGGDLFYDDGGEAGTTNMVAEGWTSAPGGDAGYGYFHSLCSTAAVPTPSWSELPIFDVPNFNTNYGAGSDVRLAVSWLSDGDDPQGRGLFIDDVKLYGVGLLAKDIAVVAVDGLLTAALDKPFGVNIGVANVGLDSLSGVVLWTANILDADSVRVHTLTSGQQPISNFPSDSILWIPTLEARKWVPEVPGAYTLAVKVVFSDNDPTNNEAIYDVLVPGGPWATPLYRCDFEPMAGQTSLEDFGWTVENGGGNALTGLNNNKWEFLPFIYGNGSALLSAFWGVLDPGPDAAAPFDSSEVLEEYIVSPPIDVSGLGKHNTLGLQFYEYYRGGYPGAAYTDFGVANNNFSVDWSVDGGATWNPVYLWEDNDGLPAGARLPNNFYSLTEPISYLSHLDFNITGALAAAKMSGSEKVWIRFGTSCENSYFVASGLDEVMVYAGISAPVIKRIDDVAQDQGKQVHLAFKGSQNDMVFQWPDVIYGDVVGEPVIQYEVWRGYEMTGTEAAATFATYEDLFNGTAQAKVGDRYAVTEADMVWDFVGIVPALDSKMYGYVAPTLWDNVDAAFLIVARTNIVNVWSVSHPMLGKSIDNLAPGAPGHAVAITEANKNTVAWEAAYTPVDDVDYYSVYRTETAGSYGAPLAKVTSLEYVDEAVTVGHTYYYVVTATDFAGNESARSNETSVVTSVDGKGSAVPTDFTLQQNYPNPFNPTTTVEYGLPAASEVTLTVYNSNGQVITTLFNGRQDAGYHKIAWDASQTSAGIYFLEFKAGSFTKMIKMTLLK